MTIFLISLNKHASRHLKNPTLFIAFSMTLLTNIRAFSTYSIYVVWRDAALQCHTKQDDRPNIRKFEMILYEFHPDNSILCLYDRSLWQFGDGTLR